MHWSRQLDTELFRLVEVCSLYPLVNSGCHYPTLHSDQNKTATQLYHQQQSSQQKKSKSASSQSNYALPSHGFVKPQTRKRTYCFWSGKTGSFFFFSIQLIEKWKEHASKPIERNKADSCVYLRELLSQCRSKLKKMFFRKVFGIN